MSVAQHGAFDLHHCSSPGPQESLSIPATHSFMRRDARTTQRTISYLQCALHAFPHVCLRHCAGTPYLSLTHRFFRK